MGSICSYYIGGYDHKEIKVYMCVEDDRGSCEDDLLFTIPYDAELLKRVGIVECSHICNADFHKLKFEYEKTITRYVIIWYQWNMAYWEGKSEIIWSHGQYIKELKKKQELSKQRSNGITNVEGFILEKED